MYRRNCRPNTIRTNHGNIILFLGFVKQLGKIQLETITREDISAFVEHEQDRGLAPTSVHSRLRTVYAFINFLILRSNIMLKKVISLAMALSFFAASAGVGLAKFECSVEAVDQDTMILKDCDEKKAAKVKIGDTVSITKKRMKKESH